MDVLNEKKCNINIYVLFEKYAFKIGGDGDGVEANITIKKNRRRTNKKRTNKHY
jgi:hypothetical protein